MAMDLTLLYHVSYGLYVVAAKDGDHANGCIINTCMQITSENPIFAIGMNIDNYTYDLIKKEKRFVLSILSEQTDPAVISAFGFFSGRDRNKFEGFRYSVREDGLPVLEENVCATLVLDVLDMTDMETHVVFYGRLTDLLEGTAKTPMTYSYYHKVIKGKHQKMRLPIRLIQVQRLRQGTSAMYADMCMRVKPCRKIMYARFAV